MTKEELAAKVEWEGGVIEAITNYGLDTADLPDDVPAQIAEAWYRVQMIAADEYLIQEWLNEAVCQ